MARSSQPKQSRGRQAKAAIEPGQETSEFRVAFSDATDKLMGRRVRLYAVIWGAVIALYALLDFFFDLEIGNVYVAWGSDDVTWAIWQRVVYWTAIGLWLAIRIGVVIDGTRSKGLPHGRATFFSQGLVACDGLLGVAFIGAGLVGPWYIVYFTTTHVVASLMFPWSPRQALQSAAVVLLGNAVATGIAEGVSQGVMIWVVVTPVLAGPGIFICWLRHSRRLERFSYNFMRHRYGSLRQELAYARSVHESLFPLPKVTGPVRFTYRYEPMRQIGGDFLHVATTGTPGEPGYSMTLVLLDVTGHGIPAALTVNRLHGEIELYFADNPDIGPGEVLGRLNRYVHLTLSRHSLFATALCLRVRPDRGEIEHASAGHPPAFLIGADGSVDDLGPTGIVLGASDDAAFMPSQETRPFGEHDSLIAYTDGVTEARGASNGMLRIDGLRGLVQAQAGSKPGERSGKLLDLVVAHRDGRMPEDDTLIVEVFRGGEHRDGLSSGEAVHRGTSHDAELINT